ncbi:MAG: T9SS type A sorting domain-containing protein [Candidatus Marinimicrobia bacterium]|nr:T9SS type A sorting domain-containing protein [Candidatus Neomarinimicrobiota bacterium]
MLSKLNKPNTSNAEYFRYGFLFWKNPFNATTTIIYELSKTDIITLNIFDMLCNLIEILVNTTQEPGQYSIDWNATKYPSGIYIIQMKVGNFVQSEKCLLLK